MTILFHAERSLGYGKPSDRASRTLMTQGAYRKTGERIRGAVGLSKTSCTKANARLEKKGFIKRTARFRDDGGCGPTEYEIQWPELAKSFLRTQAKKSYPCSPSEQPPVHLVASPRVHLVNTNRGNHHQQRKSKQKLAVESSLEERATSKSKVKPKGKPKNATPLSLNGIDDDETRKPPIREPLADPTQELLARLTERHGEKMGPQALNEVLDLVRIGLGERNLSITPAFLEFEARTTTNPSALTNPPGHYRRLPKKFENERVKQGLGARLERVQQHAVQLQQQAATPRCASCKGSGLLDALPENLEAGNFCSCTLGVELSRIEQKKAQDLAAKLAGPGRAAGSSAIGSTPSQ